MIEGSPLFSLMNPERFQSLANKQGNKIVLGNFRVVISISKMNDVCKNFLNYYFRFSLALDELSDNTPNQITIRP